MKNNLLATAAITLALCAFAACSHSASSSESGGTSAKSAAAAGGSSAGGDWTANGATACEKYLTPDVVAGIWTHPASHFKAGDDGSACSYQSDDSGRSIAIMLAKDGPESFDAIFKYLVDPAPLPNVGDKASLTANGVVAVKGDNRNCHINVYGEDAALKVSREALGQKLGEICNKLFALP
ncbi:MAG TPA: hypothetical protein VIC03_11090 [Gemmatimonadaceae bacterium]|jgi:hypothetical protein